MIKIYSNSYKVARRGEVPPGTLQYNRDIKDPYKRYKGPNSGEGNNLTTIFSGPLAGEPESMGWSAVSPTKSYSEFNNKSHPYSENGDPDQQFNIDEETDSSSTQYGDGGYSEQFYEDSSPMSRNDRAFNQKMRGGSLENKLNKKRINR